MAVPCAIFNSAAVRVLLFYAMTQYHSHTCADQYGIEDVAYFWNRGEAVSSSPDASVRHVVTGNCSGEFESVGELSNFVQRVS